MISPKHVTRIIKESKKEKNYRVIKLYFPTYISNITYAHVKKFDIIYDYNYIEEIIKDSEFLAVDLMSFIIYDIRTGKTPEYLYPVAFPYKDTEDIDFKSIKRILKHTDSCTYKRWRNEFNKIEEYMNIETILE